MVSAGLGERYPEEVAAGSLLLSSRCSERLAELGATGVSQGSIRGWLWGLQISIDVVRGGGDNGVRGADAGIVSGVSYSKILDDIASTGSLYYNVATILQTYHTIC